MSAATLSYEELLSENLLQKEQIDSLKLQVEWFQKQFFGSKSERLISDSPQQLVFFPEMAPVEKPAKHRSHCLQISQ